VRSVTPGWRGSTRRDNRVRVSSQMAPARANRWHAALIVLSVLFVAPRAVARPFDPASHDWEGFADFVDLARAKLGSSLVVSSQLDFGKVKGDDSLILIHPERHLDVDSLAAFIAAGGRVVLLDDFGTGDRLLRRFDIKRSPLPASPQEALRHNPQLAIAEPVGNSDLVRDVARVVTNHAMGLLHPSLTPLLEVRSRGQGGAPEEGSVVIALVGQAGRGKLVVVGDPSALMNSMLRYPGNAQLARNLSAFVERSGGKVYLQSGPFEQVGAFAGSSVLGGATHDAMAPFALDRLTGIGPRVLQVLAALLGLGLVIWIAGIAGRTYRVTRPRITRIIPLHTQGGAAGHAAAVGARGVPREIAMIEIGKALEEELALALGLPQVPQGEELVGRLLAAGLLDRASAAPLRKLLSQAAHIETLTGAGRATTLPRLGDDDVLAAARVAAKARAAIHGRARTGRAA
jgi:hypothetical protein